MKLQADLPGAIDLEKAEGPVVPESDLRVRGVVTQHDAVPVAELHRALQEFTIRHRRGGIVRIVEPHQPCALGCGIWDRVEIRQPVVLGRERHDVRLSSRHQRPGHVGRVAGVRRQDDIAGVDQRQGRVADPVLRAQRRQDLCGRVEHHIEAIAVPIRDRPAKLGQPEIRRVAMVGGVRGCLLQNTHDSLRRGQVGVADAERDNIHARSFLLLHPSIDLREEIRRDQAQALGACGGGSLHAGSFTYLRIAGAGLGSISNHLTRSSRRHHRSWRRA